MKIPPNPSRTETIYVRNLLNFILFENRSLFQVLFYLLEEYKLEFSFTTDSHLGDLRLSPRCK